MNPLTCLSPERTLLGASANSKKKIFETLSQLIADTCPELTEQNVIDSFFAREKIGCTAIGNGIALPHGRACGCDEILGALMLLETPVDYDAPDGQPVDIIFALLVPEQAHKDHIMCLSSIAKLLKQPTVINQIRNAYSNQALYDIVESATQKLDS